MPVANKVVMELMKKLLEEGGTLFTDNWYIIVREENTPNWYIKKQ